MTSIGSQPYHTSQMATVASYATVAITATARFEMAAREITAGAVAANPTSGSGLVLPKSGQVWPVFTFSTGAGGGGGDTYKINGQ
jgi:hypothetical protein